MKSRAGFTLIELTVALAILVIASGVILVRVSGWSGRQALHASARTLGNTIRLWRERSRTEETSYRLSMDEGAYQITVGKEILRRGQLGGGAQFEDGPSSVLLSPRGILPDTRITLRNASGDRVTLVLGTLLNEIDYQELR